MNLCSGIEEHIALLSQFGTLLIAAKKFNLFESVVDMPIYLNNKHSQGIKDKSVSGKIAYTECNG